MTATLTASNGIQIQLTEAQLGLLQKACHKLSKEIDGTIYDFRVYYNGAETLLAPLQEEKKQLEAIRTALEDLED